MPRRSIAAVLFVVPLIILTGCFSSRNENQDPEETPFVGLSTAVELNPSVTPTQKLEPSTVESVDPQPSATDETDEDATIDVRPTVSQTATTSTLPTATLPNDETPTPTIDAASGTTPVVTAGGEFPLFVRNYIDTNYGGNGRPGWVQAGDMDGDGDIDIVAGGGEALFVYENDGQARGWARYGSLDGTGQIGANGGQLHDVDSDGDLDVVSAKYYKDLGWWENPGGPLSNTPWLFHALTSGNSRYLHDIIRVDLDKDGQAEEFVANLNSRNYWNTQTTVNWFRPGDDPKQLWESHTIEADRNEGAPHGHSGIDVGDIDDDGDIDLAYSNGWYESSGDPKGNWTWHQVTDIYGISNSLVRDMDGDENLDLVMSGGHHGQGAYWFENSGGALINWAQHDISTVVGDVTKRYRYSNNESKTLHHPECLQVLDLNGDNELDVVTCDLFFGEDPGEPGWDEEVHNVYVYENTGGAVGWNKHNVAPNSYPSHLLQIVDVNKDGRMDIISESTGYSVVSYFESSSN